MKKKLLESLEKKDLRRCVKYLLEVECDKMNRDKLIALLEPCSYTEITKALHVS